MTTTNHRFVIGAVAAAVTVPLLGAFAVSQASYDAPETTAPAKAKAVSFDFDVSEDATRFRFDDAPVFDDGMPAAGNGFVTQGFIYEDDTLNEGDGDGVIVDADGTASPEFPGQVIGEWTCYGTMINGGARETEDAWVVSTQVYEFEDGSTLISAGSELPPGAGTQTRAITGGTGDYAGASGEIAQTSTGFNGSEGINVDFSVDLIGKPGQHGNYGH